MNKKLIQCRSTNGNIFLGYGNAVLIIAPSGNVYINGVRVAFDPCFAANFAANLKEQDNKKTGGKILEKHVDFYPAPKQNKFLNFFTNLFK